MSGKINGSYYIKTIKSGKWYLYFEVYIHNKKTQKRVPNITYSELGLNPELSLEDAKIRVSRLNKERSLSRRELESRINSSDNISYLKSLDEVFFPTQYLKEFFDKILLESYSGINHQKKIKSHFKFLQNMVLNLKLQPSQFEKNKDLIFKYFIKMKITSGYSRKLIGLLNSWGSFVSEKELSYFAPIKKLPTRVSAQIDDSQRTKRGKNTELGVRTVSNPLVSSFLNSKKDELDPKVFNYLLLSIWFGLRPSEIDSLKDQKTWQIIEYNGISVLKIYQSKLIGVKEEDRWKLIPCILEEQLKCLEIIKGKDFKKPLIKTLRKAFETDKITLYSGRKGFVDLMLDKNQKIENISLWLGHRSLNTTWKFYKQKNLVKFDEVS